MNIVLLIFNSMQSKNFHLYSLSNPHFERIEITTNNNSILKGQFVEFKVVNDDIEFLYPSEKLCFLPEEKKKLFWNDFTINKGEFSVFPSYIKLYGLNDILKICIEPLQVF
jgi:hypothetical protein